MSAFIQGGGDVFGPAGAVAGNIPQFDDVSGKIIKDGKAAPAGTIVGTTDTQSLSNKTFTVGTATYRLSGVLYCDPVLKQTSGTTDTTLYSYSLPGNTVTRAGDQIKVRVTGQAAAAAGAKTNRFRIGGIMQFTAAMGNTTFPLVFYEWLITHQGSGLATKQSLTTMYDDGTSRLAIVDVLNTTTVDFTISNTLAVAGQCPAAGRGDFHFYQVEFLPAL